MGCFRANDGNPIPHLLSDKFRTIARREEGLPIGYGGARNPQNAKVAITASQISTVVFHNNTDEETGDNRHRFYALYHDYQKIPHDKRN